MMVFNYHLDNLEDYNIKGLVIAFIFLTELNKEFENVYITYMYQHASVGIGHISFSKITNYES